MPVYSFDAIAISDLTISGPDPFLSNSVRNLNAISNNTQFTISGSSAWTEITVDDGDTVLEDGDLSQDLNAGVTFNGTNWSAGDAVHIEYSYVVRPVGSTDPSEQITIYALEVRGDVQGVTADSRLAEDVTYEIISGGSGDPVVSYSRLVVCFVSGTRIATPGGAVPVETLRPGDLVETLDHGVQPLVWVAHQTVRGLGQTAPIRLGAGVLGNDEPLELSPQHRVLIGQGARGAARGAIAAMLECTGAPRLLAAKALNLGSWDVAPAPRERVRYHHLVFARHEIISANGAVVESMLPGPMALKALPANKRRELFNLFPELAHGAQWYSARPILRTGVARRRLKRSLWQRS